MTTYPEHERMREQRDAIDAVAGFLAWAGAEGYLLLRPADRWPNRIDAAETPPIERLLAEHFGIDPRRLEAEKRAMLAELLAGGS